MLGNKRLGKAIEADRRVDQAEEEGEVAGRDGRHRKGRTTLPSYCLTVLPPYVLGGPSRARTTNATSNSSNVMPYIIPCLKMGRG